MDSVPQAEASTTNGGGETVLYKRCTKCGTVKHRSEFYKHKTCRDGIHSRCRECVRESTNAHIRKDHASSIMTNVRSRSKEKGHPLDIDLAWCRERLAGVDRCELTGWKLNKGPRKPGGHGMNPYAPSFDRIDNDVGYTPDNIRVVCVFVNHMMQSHSDEDMAPIIKALREAAHEPPA